MWTRTVDPESVTEKASEVLSRAKAAFDSCCQSLAYPCGSDEETRKFIKIDPSGKDVKIRLLHQPTEVGRKLYIVEVEIPKAARDDKGPNLGNLRLERTIDVHIKSLRRKLGGAGEHIETVRGVGYRFRNESNSN